MSDFGTELAHLMAGCGVGVRELARMMPCNPGHISNLRSGKARPSAELAEALDERLKADGSLRALIPAHERRRPQLAASWDDGAGADEIAAMELGRLAKATEVGTSTVERLELAVDELAIAYPSAEACVSVSDCDGRHGAKPQPYRNCTTWLPQWLPCRKPKIEQAT